MNERGVRLQADHPAPQLTIRSVRTTAVHVPMKRALGTSARRMDIAPLVLIDVETGEGVTGRAYVFCYLPAATTAVAAIVARGRGACEGRSRRSHRAQGEACASLQAARGSRHRDDGACGVSMRRAGTRWRVAASIPLVSLARRNHPSHSRRTTAMVSA